MSTSVPIPLVPLAQGQQNQATVAVSDPTMSIMVTLNRNVGAQPLDGLPSTLAFTVDTAPSFDGGSTFLTPPDEEAIVGGPITAGRPPVVTHTNTFGYPDGIGSSQGHPGDHLRVTTKASQAFSVSGSITLG